MLATNRDFIRFSFGVLIQNDLNQFATEWNTHRIRESRMANAPGGTPNVLYYFPYLNGEVFKCGLFVYMIVFSL